MGISIDYDERVGTLYVKREGERCVVGQPGKDLFLIRSLNEDRRVVGATLCCADKMSLSDWRNHPDRQSLPADIRMAIDRWIRNRVA